MTSLCRHLATVLSIGLAVASTGCATLTVKGNPKDSTLVVVKGEVHAKNYGLTTTLGGEFETFNLSMVGLQARAGGVAIGQRVSGELMSEIRRGYFVFDDVKPGEYRVARLGYSMQTGNRTCNSSLSPSANTYRQNPNLAFKAEPGQIVYVGIIVLDVNRDCDAGSLLGFRYEPQPADEKAVLVAMAKLDAIKASPWLTKINERIAAINR